MEVKIIFQNLTFLEIQYDRAKVSNVEIRYLLFLSIPSMSYLFLKV